MGVTSAKGFTAGTAASGSRKSGADDVVVIASDRPCAVAGVFTTNQMAAPPIAQAKEAIADGALRAVVVNAGNANACTGPRGLEDAFAMAVATAAALGIDPDAVAAASTGVIGVPLDTESLLPAIERAAGSLGDDGEAAARAIMTTDTVPKQALATVDVDGIAYTIGGVAKGAGMIRPDMATMLCFVTTDAPLDAAACAAALDAGMEGSFGRITVDGDTSTNDCCLLLANGAGGGGPIGCSDPAFSRVAAAVADVLATLAEAVVRDGEGATKFVEVTVGGAETEAAAHEAAMAIADSLLVKCALFGQDANWGRVVSAAGASSARLDPTAVSVRFAGILVADGGTAVPFDEDEASAALAARDLTIECDLGVGTASATVWTCDLSYDYVRINGDYRT